MLHRPAARNGRVSAVRELPLEKSPETPTQRILIVDDDVELCELVAEYLKPEGYAVEMVHNGLQSVDRLLAGKFALVILDVMLPGIKGFEVLRRIRASSSVPVIMLTARGDDVDRILGLEIGADDYLPKPFNPRELTARVQAVLRRTQAAATTTSDSPAIPIVFGDIELDPGARIVRRGSRAVDVTSVEFGLLAVFLQSPGRVISRDDLAKDVLGRELSAFDRSIDVHISNLRKKLGPAPGGGERIKNIRGVGYIYATPNKSRTR
jgi:two-component system, OmpR family, response regulator CpxR